MTQRKGATGVMPEHDLQRPPIDHLRTPADLTGLAKDLNAKPSASQVVTPTRHRRTVWVAALATAAVLVLGAVASLGGSDAEQAGGSPRARSNAAEEPLGSDRHLENQARRAEEGAAHGRNLHRENS